MTDTIETEILEFITRICRSPQRIANARASLFESQVLDSMNLAEVLGFLETRFGISVKARDLTPDNFDSVSAMARFVRSKKTS